MKKIDFTEEIMNNNSLVEYLESEIEKLKNEIENKKNRHYVNQNIIEECQERIKQYRDREDSVFSLLSPISVESSYKLKIAEENKIIEETNSENMVLISEIDECNNKITKDEWQKLKQRILTNNDIENLKISRITDGDLSIFTDEDKKVEKVHRLY